MNTRQSSGKSQACTSLPEFLQDFLILFSLWNHILMRSESLSIRKLAKDMAYKYI